MPKVLIDATKGLYQVSGGGLNITPQVVTPAADEVITVTEALVLADLSANTTTNGAQLSDGESAGDVIIVVNTGTSGFLSLGGANNDSVTIGQNEAALLVWTGTAWAFLAN